MIYELASKPAIREAVVNGRAGLVSDRIIDALVRTGSVLGPGAIAIRADGTVSVDADRDPSAVWATFDPAAPTTAETAFLERRRQLRLALTQIAAHRTQLQANHAAMTGPTPPATVPTLRKMIDDNTLATDEALQDIAGIINVLIDRALIEKDN